MSDRKKFLGLALMAVSAIIVMKVSVFTGALMFVMIALVVGAMALHR